MIKFVDYQLNKITMYRLVLYILIAYLVIAFIFGVTGVLSYDPFALLLSVAVLLAACAVVNWAFGKVFNIPTNVESVYISALILALIISPIKSLNDLWFLLWASVLAMASKFIVAYRGKHLFNPIALAVALTYYTLNQSASWWVGSGPMLPFVLIGGLLLVRKIRRFGLVLSFVLTVAVTTLFTSPFTGSNYFTTMQKLLLYSPFLFLGSVILTEPLTTPPTQKLQMVYGALVGVLSNPQIHFGSFYITPELAILVGNLFSYIVSPKDALVLKFREKTRLSPDTYEFTFAPDRKLAFIPGQYMEWTLGHDSPDSRGNRRFFTLASAPTEHNLKVGVKFPEKSSSYKKALLAMKRDTLIVVTALSGDFVLPKNPRQKLVFIAGGIGITPFRSMIKYLLDIRQRRPIILFYSVKSVAEIAYKDIFDLAARELGIKVIYAVTDTTNIPAAWTGKIGRITVEQLKAEVPDYRRSEFYISGPDAMVDGFKESLSQLGIKGSQIKTDYFPGF